MYQQVGVEGINKQCKGYVARCNMLGKQDIVDIKVYDLGMYTDDKKYCGEVEVTKRVRNKKVTLVVDIDCYYDEFKPLSFIDMLVQGLNKYYDSNSNFYYDNNSLKDLCYNALSTEFWDDITKDTLILKLDNIGYIKSFIIDDIVITMSKDGEDDGYEESYLYKVWYYDDEDGRDKESKFDDYTNNKLGIIDLKDRYKKYKYIRFLVSDTDNNKLGTIDIKDEKKLFKLLWELFNGISIMGQAAQRYEDNIYNAYKYQRKPWRHSTDYIIEVRHIRSNEIEYLYNCRINDYRDKTHKDYNWDF